MTSQAKKDGSVTRWNYIRNPVWRFFSIMK